MEQTPELTPVERLERCRVLLVEDNPLFEDLVYEAVRRIAIRQEVTACRTGSEALDVIDRLELDFDVVLVDLGLPDMSGLDVIRAVHQRAPVVPIMVISVMSSERSVVDAIRAGARGYLLKSDPEHAVAAGILQVLQGNYPISPALARTLFRLAGAPGDPDQPGALDLTPREVDTLRYLAQGHTYKESARLMGVHVSTVQTYVRSLYRKLGAHSQAQAIARARDHKLI